MSPDNLVLVQLGRIGDMIMQLPVIEAVHAQHPALSIHVLASRNNAQIVDGHPAVRQVFIYDKSPGKVLKLVRQIRKMTIDIWVDPKDHASRESQIFARLSNAVKTVGYNPPDKNIFDVSIPSDVENVNLHAIERNFQVMKIAGLLSDSAVPSLTLTVAMEDENRFQQFKMANGIGPYAVLNLSANVPERLWSETGWTDLLEKLKENDHQAILISGPNEKSLASRLTERAGWGFYYATENIRQVYPVIKAAQWLVTPDTAVVHVASAYNTPVIGLYPNHSPNFNKFKPLSDTYQVIYAPESTNQVADIEVSKVLTAVQSIIGITGLPS